MSGVLDELSEALAKAYQISLQNVSDRARNRPTCGVLPDRLVKLSPSEATFAGA